MKETVLTCASVRLAVIIVLAQELYDHRTDPKEQNNLAESSLEIVERISKQLATHQDNKKVAK